MPYAVLIQDLSTYRVGKDDNGNAGNNSRSFRAERKCRDSRQPMFEALKSTKRSSTRILFAYFIPCMHSFGSIAPRLLTIFKLPLFA